MGWNPIVVDHEDAWEPQSWQHRLGATTPKAWACARTCTRMGRSLASLARKEFALGKSE
jgi:hypothetical protein